jgi:putative multiple sugar transport system permease protein
MPKIPSFIVTLAGMLVFKGLALAVLQGQSVGPFSPTFQKLSSGFIPELFPGAGALYPTSLLIGAMLALFSALVSFLREIHLATNFQNASWEARPTQSA